MRLPVKITCVILIFALLTSCEAATENKDMPIKEEVTNFIDNFEAPESGDFTNSAYDAFIKEYPAGHCDIWSNGMISFYYYDPDSPKEYGRIYLDSNGKKVKSGGAGITCIKSYTGEENTPVDTTPAEISADSISEQHATAQEPATTAQEPATTAQEPAVTTPEPAVTTPEPAVTTPEPAVTTPETIWDNQIFSGIFVGVVVAFIACMLRFNH